MKLPAFLAGFNYEVAALKLGLLLLFGAMCYWKGVTHEQVKQARQEANLATSDRDKAIEEINRRVTNIAKANKTNQAQEISIHDIQKALDEALAHNPTTGCNLSPDELRAFQRAASETSSIVSGSGLPKPK